MTRFPVTLVALVIAAALMSVPLVQAASPATELATFPRPDQVLQPGNAVLGSAENVWTVNTLGNSVVVLAALTSTTQAPLSLLEQFGDSTRAFDEPYAVALDAADNIYVSDCGNSRVAVLAALTSTSASPRSEIHSFTANGTFACPSSVVFTSVGDIVVSDGGNNRVVLLAGLASLEPGAVLATLDPTTDSYGGFSGNSWVAIDAADNLYVADTGNGRIVVLAALSSSEPGAELFSFDDGYTFDEILGVSVDAAGRIYVTDGGAAAVIVLAGINSTNPAPGTQLAFLNDTSRPLEEPVGGVAFDTAGNIYIADDYRSAVVVLRGLDVPDSNTERASFALAQHAFAEPYILSVDSSGTVYVPDSIFNAVFVLDGLGSASPGSVLYTFNSSGGVAFNAVSAVKLDTAGNLYIADQYNDRVCVLASISSTTAAPGEELFNIALPALSQPRDVALDAAGNVYVTCEGSSSITVFSSISSASPGTVLQVFTDITTPFRASSLRGIALDTQGRTYVASIGGFVIVLAALSSGLPAGTELFSFSNSDDPSGLAFFEPVGLALDPSGRIYVADNQFRVVVLASVDSATPGAHLYSLYDPTLFIGLAKGVALDSHLNILVSDPNNGLIHVLAGLPAAGSALGDPQFVGFRGRSYQVHGLDGAVYNVLSDAEVQLNARFVFLDSGVCPPTAVATKCWTHAGSYFGEVALQTLTGGRLLVQAGGAADGLAAVLLDGQPLALPDAATSVNHSSADGSITVRVRSRWQLDVSGGNYELQLANSDRFINLESVRVVSWTRMSSVLQPHGLLGPKAGATNSPPQGWRWPLWKGGSTTTWRPTATCSGPSSSTTSSLLSHSSAR